jgi:hypothetical protein
VKDRLSRRSLLVSAPALAARDVPRHYRINVEPMSPELFEF